MTENNNTEKDELRDLFSQFKPRMTGEADFMAQLESKLSAIEDVKELHRAHYSQLKKAVGIAAFIGFAIGVVLTLSFPWIMTVVKALMDSIVPTTPSVSNVVTWIIISVASVTSAIAAYDLSLYPSVQAKLK